MCKRHGNLEVSSEAQVIQDSAKARSEAIRIRADGAICVGSKCIQVKPAKGGELELRLCDEWANNSECPGCQDRRQHQPDKFDSSRMKHGKEQTCEPGASYPDQISWLRP